MTTDQPLRIGTRGSPLARRQTEMAVARLVAAEPGLPAPEIVVVSTTGDRVQDRPLAEIGGKGLFAKEIEQAMLAGDIDAGVHSLKDLETALPAGLCIAAVLPRADPRDALIAPAARAIEALPLGARIATGSVRRLAQLLALRPDLTPAPLRGNIGTRLEKIRAGEAAATFLAMAGLLRLGLDVPEATPLDPAIMLPAAGQGLIALQCRADDRRTFERLSALRDAAAATAMRAERALLAGLDGSCRTPIGALAMPTADGIELRALVASLDGRTVLRTQRRGPAGDAERLGRDAARELRARAPADLFAAA
jgi:hydroxymethylbilane synthase